MTDNKELNDALQQLDTYSKAYVQIQNTIDKIHFDRADVVLGPLRNCLVQLITIHEYFVKMAGELDGRIRRGPKDHMLAFEFNLVQKVCELLHQTTESARESVGEAIKKAVLP